jgi:hypothetical protein
MGLEVELQRSCEGQARKNRQPVNPPTSLLNRNQPSTATSMNPILTIDSHGTITGLYTELIELPQLGRLEITRATTIEFNTPTQQWEVKDAAGAILFVDPSRSCCLAWELERFNQ